MTIADLQNRKDLELIQLDYDIEFVNDYFGIDNDDKYDGFLVKIEDGDYIEVYGFYGVPYLYKNVYKIDQINTK